MPAEISSSVPSLFLSFSNASLHDNVPVRLVPRKLLMYDLGWVVQFVFGIKWKIGKQDCRVFLMIRCVEFWKWNGFASRW